MALLEERLLDSVQVPQKQQGPQKRNGCTSGVEQNSRSWTNDAPDVWSETAVLQGMARCEHILQSVADMRAPIITEQHQNTFRGKAEQLIKQGSDLILKQATDCCTQINLVFTTMDFWWFLPLTVGWAVLDGGGG